MVRHDLTESFVLLGEEKLLNSSSTKRVQREGGRVDAGSLETRVDPLLEVRLDERSPVAAGGGKEEDRGVRGDLVPAHHAGQGGQGSDWAEHGIVGRGQRNFLNPFIELNSFRSSYFYDHRVINLCEGAPGKDTPFVKLFPGNRNQIRTSQHG